MGIYRHFRKNKRLTRFPDVSDVAVDVSSLPRLSTLLCFAFVLNSAAIIQIAYGQHYLGMEPLAVDSLKSISDPYLTRHWYDGYFYYYWDGWDGEAGRESDEPLWLTYVETDEVGIQRICANNFAFSYLHQVDISPVSTIAESDPDVSLREPIIENYLGGAVAIWLEEDLSRTDLFYSIRIDDEWSSPEMITDDSLTESSHAFFTVDAECLSDQDEVFNCLFWVRGNRICRAELDENWQWHGHETIYEGRRPLGHLVPRMTVNGDLWLLFDEVHEPDSVHVKALIRFSTTDSWIGPCTLLRLAGEASQANLDFSYWHAPWDDILVLSWVENQVFVDTLVSCTGPAIAFLPEDDEWPQEEYAHFNYVSNTLFGEVGCVVVPLPHYLCAVDNSGVQRLLMHNEDSYPGYDIEITTTDNSIAELALSGVNQFHSVGAWTEDDGLQSDLFVAFFWFLVGSAEHGPQPSDQFLYLYPAYPNPVNQSTTITYVLANPQNIDLGLYDSLGRRVKQIAVGWHPEGTYRIPISARDIPQGAYYCTLSSEHGKIARILVVNR